MVRDLEHPSRTYCSDACPQPDPASRLLLQMFALLQPQRRVCSSISVCQTKEASSKFSWSLPHVMCSSASASLEEAEEPLSPQSDPLKLGLHQSAGRVFLLGDPSPPSGDLHLLLELRQETPPVG